MIFVALGSNRAGNWGSPAETVQEAVGRIGAGPYCRLLCQSGLYATAGIGPGRPAPFVNAVVQIDCHMPPRALLSFVKHVERAAGTRSSMPWGPRSLDLDIIDYRGIVRGWRRMTPPGSYRAWGQLFLPHPQAHLRPFVLQPLTDFAPQWRHPVFHVTAARLLGRLSGRAGGKVLKKLP